MRGALFRWDIPRFAKDPSDFKEHLPRCVVKQKKADLNWWRPWIHQLLLFVGTARQGQGANKRWIENNKGAQWGSKCK